LSEGLRDGEHTLHSRDPAAELHRNLKLAESLDAQFTNVRLDGSGHGWPPEGLTLRSGAAKAGVDALYDDGSLEFGEDTCHLKERFAGSGRGVDLLLMQVQADPLLLQLVKESRQMSEAAAEPIDRPGGDHIELALGGITPQPIECGALIAPLGAADAMVDIFADNLPSALLSDAGEVLALILDGLAASAHPEIQADALCSWNHRAPHFKGSMMLRGDTEIK
jgi:hypothetical protein